MRKLSAVVFTVSSFQVDSRVPKHFWHHCLFMNSLCFLLMLKTLQAAVLTSVSPLICNCTCHLKNARHRRRAFSLITLRFQSTNSLSWLSYNSGTPIIQSWVCSSELTLHKRHRQGAWKRARKPYNQHIKELFYWLSYCFWAWHSGSKCPVTSRPQFTVVECL